MNNARFSVGGLLHERKFQSLGRAEARAAGRLRQAAGRPRVLRVNQGRVLSVLYHGYGDMEIWRYGDMEIWRYGDMEIWRYGDMEIWRERIWRYGDMEIWRYMVSSLGNGDMQPTCFHVLEREERRSAATT